MRPNLFSPEHFDEGPRPVLADELSGHPMAISEPAFSSPRAVEPDAAIRSCIPSATDGQLSSGNSLELEKDGKRPLYDILLIEDEVPFRELLSTVLSCVGYSVLTAGDGKTGLDLLSRHRFRLVITDIFMPENDGLEVIMKQMAAQPDSRILAMSGFSGYTDIPTILRMAEVLGSQRTLVKPFRLSEFWEAVYALVNDSPQLPKVGARCPGPGE
jgi:two-component system cell cycle response regulator CpdR